MAKKKNIFTRLFEKLDSRMKEKADASECCCCGDSSDNSDKKC